MKNSFGHGLFVTGTDTGIGKTYVCRLLLEGFAGLLSVTYMKPVQTGCIRDTAGTLHAPDFEYCMGKDAIINAEMDDHVPYRFEPACSPHLAASRAGVMISLDHIRQKYIRVSNKKTVTIVEGAGGVLTPISETTSMLDLIEYLRLPVIIVTSPRVGTLNHTLLTLNALAGRNINPAGIVINNGHEVEIDYIYHDNCRVLQDHAFSSLFLEISHDCKCNDSIREFCKSLHESI